MKYLIDTNCILNNPNFYNTFQDCEIAIPICVLKELDNIKTRDNEAGFKARKFFRNFKKIEDKGNILEGIELDNNVVIRFIDDVMCVYDHADDIIIQTALQLPEYTILTNDTSMRAKALVTGAKAIRMEITEAEAIESQYSGCTELQVDKKHIDSFIKNKNIDLKKIDKNLEMSPNEFFIGTCSETYKKMLGRHLNGKLYKLHHYNYNPFGIEPKDDKQKFLIEAIMNKSINMVSVTGKQGCGKTYISLATALDLIENKEYEKILIAKNTAPLDKYSYQGFTTGDTEEKLLTHFGNFSTNLENLKAGKSNENGKKILEKLIEKGTLEVLDISSILGSSFENKIIIIDEAQSFDVHAMRSIITRVGETSKLILIGDIGQQTIAKLEPSRSGLYASVEWLKEIEETAHITLETVHRSKFVEKASILFDERIFG